MQRQLYLAAYDVRDGKRLREALYVLKQYGSGGQKSVFECFLTGGERKQLLREISGVITREDRFLLVRLEAGARFRTLGVASPPEYPSFVFFG